MEETRVHSSPEQTFDREKVLVGAGLAFKGEIKSRGPWELLALQNSGSWSQHPCGIDTGQALRQWHLWVPYWGQGLCWYAVAHQALCAAASSSSIHAWLTTNRDSHGVRPPAPGCPSGHLPHEPPSGTHHNCFPFRDPSGREASQPEGTYYPLHREAPGSPVQCH